MKNKALLFALRDCTSVMRSTSALVLVVFSWVMYSPAAFAFYSTGVDESAPQDKFAPKAQVFMESLSEFQDIVVTQYQDLKALDSNEKLKKSSAGITKDSDFYQALNELQTTTLEQEVELRELWPAIEQTYPDYANYSEALKAKLATLEDERKKNMAKQMARVQYAFNTARSAVILDTPKAINALAQSLKALEKLNSQQGKHSWDNEQLPFGTLPNAAREPSDSQSQLLENLGLQATKKTAATSNSMMRSLSSVSAKASVSTSADAGADVGNAENLAEGIEIQFSDDIKTKVEELNYDPVQIYNWVYNNIKFIPSYGSLQGAAQAFDLKAGNATDTASILISMLRYAGTEAKYKIGTIEVGVDEARNWVGGVDYADSVQVLLGQGGIPNALMAYQSGTQNIKLEHTWVEAYVNDSWVSLDPSFKQYVYSEGLDLESEVPFDGTDLASQLESGLTSNEAEGWVQGLDQTAIETAMTNYQQSLETFINDNHADATVSDILGGQAIVETQALELPSALPYQKVIAEVSSTILPEAMRHKFKYELQYTSLKLEDYTANLAGKALAVSFKPATEADEQLLLDYLPASIESESDIPSSLPYGLFNVIGEFTVDGEVVSTSGAMKLGTELKNELGYYSPRFGWGGDIQPHNRRRLPSRGHGFTRSECQPAY